MIKLYKYSHLCIYYERNVYANLNELNNGK